MCLISVKQEIGVMLSKNPNLKLSRASMFSMRRINDGIEDIQLF